MSDDIDAQMLQTLELLHYCRRFAERLFTTRLRSDNSSVSYPTSTKFARKLTAGGLRPILYHRSISGSQLSQEPFGFAFVLIN